MGKFSAKQAQRVGDIKYHWVSSNGLGVENAETLNYPTHVPINIQIWTSQGCSDLEISRRFDLIQRCTAL